jgi:hypothetical protein
MASPCHSPAQIWLAKFSNLPSAEERTERKFALSLHGIIIRCGIRNEKRILSIESPYTAAAAIVSFLPSGFSLSLSGQHLEFRLLLLLGGNPITPAELHCACSAPDC